MLTTNTKPIKIYVDTDIVYGSDKYDSHGDFIMASIDYDDDLEDGNKNDKLLVNMTVDSEHVKVLYEIHDHLKDNLLVELDMSVDLSDEKTIDWTLEYDLKLEHDIKQELIDFVNENVLTHNIVLYYDGERLDATTVLAL